MFKTEGIIYLFETSFFFAVDMSRFGALDVSGVVYSPGADGPN